MVSKDKSATRGKQSGTKQQQQTPQKTSTSKASCDDVGEIVSSILGQLIPVLVKTIAAAVDAAVSANMTKITEESGKNIELEQKMLKHAILSRYELDRLEQYSRRESIRVNGIDEAPGPDGEDLTGVMVQLGKKIGIDLKSSDISVVHRLGRKSDKPRPVLCKFVARSHKDAFMKKRKGLKDIPEFKTKVFINEDLTQLKAKLMAYAKSLDNVKRVNSYNGRLFCTMTNEKTEILDNPDDLFKLGVMNLDYNRLGLSNFKTE